VCISHNNDTQTWHILWQLQFCDADTNLMKSWPPIWFVIWTSWPLKMGLIGWPKTSIHNYHSMLCNIPAECRSQLFDLTTSQWWLCHSVEKLCIEENVQNNLLYLLCSPAQPTEVFCDGVETPVTPVVLVSSWWQLLPGLNDNLHHLPNEEISKSTVLDTMGAMKSSAMLMKGTAKNGCRVVVWTWIPAKDIYRCC
jgi:hypothetical protein